MLSTTILQNFILNGLIEENKAINDCDLGEHAFRATATPPRQNRAVSAATRQKQWKQMSQNDDGGSKLIVNTTSSICHHRQTAASWECGMEIADKVLYSSACPFFYIFLLHAWKWANKAIFRFKRSPRLFHCLKVNQNASFGLKTKWNKKRRWF